MEADRGVVAWPYLRAAYDGGASASLTDGQLLERFALRGGEASALAFAALVERHGPLVLRACRASLGDEHDAEDAFQAVFLVLARKASHLRVVDTLAPWLLDVSRRTSAEARSIRARRRSREVSGVDLPEPASTSTDPDDPAPLIREELSRLPDRYQAPLLLCDLEGLTQEEAARRLGWPVGTLKSRQSRGRSRLRTRLIRRGLAPSAIATLASGGRASATVPASLAASTISAALGKASPAAMALMEGVFATMWLKRWMMVAAVLCAVGIPAGVGLARRAGSSLDDPPRAGSKPTTRTATARPIREILLEVKRTIRLERWFNNQDMIAIAHAQNRVGDHGGAGETAREAAANIETERGWQREKCYDLIEIARALDAAGDRPGAKEALDRADASVEQTRNLVEQFRARLHLVEARLDLGDRPAAEQAVRAMAGVKFARDEDDGAALHLIRAQIALGQIDDAFRTAATVGAGDDLLGTSLLLCIAEAVSGWPPSAGPWRQPAAAERRSILERVEKAIGGLKVVDNGPYVRLARCWIGLGATGEALRLLERINKDDADPAVTADLLSGIAVAQAKAGRRDESRDSFRRALALVGSGPGPIADEGRGRVALSQAAAGDLTSALETIGTLRPGLRPRWLEKIVPLQLKAGDRVGARATLSEAIRQTKALREKKQAGPDDGSGLVMELAFADARLALGDIDAVVAALARLEDPPKRRDLAGKIARARSEAGEADRAFSWALTLEPGEVRRAALRGLVEGVTLPPNQATARPIRDILREASRSTRSDTTAPRRAYDLSEVAQAQVRVGDPAGAKETARAAVEAAARLPADKAFDALITAAWACEASGDRAAGSRALETAQRRIGGVELAGGDDLALFRFFLDRQSILVAQLQLGHREDAVANVRAMVGAFEKLKGDDSRQFAAATMLVEAQTCVGDYEEALRTAKSVGEAHAQGTLLAKIARTLSPANHLSMQSQRILTPEERKARLPILDRIEKEVEAFESPEDKHLGELAKTYAFLGDLDSSIRLSRRFGKGPVNQPDPVKQMEDCSSLSVISGLLGEAGRLEEARTILRELIDLPEGDPGLANWRSGLIAVAQAKAGDSAGAFKTAEAVDLGQRAPIFSGIAGLQKKAGDRAGARATLRIALGAAEDLLKNPPPPPAKVDQGGVTLKIAGAEGQDADPERSRQDDCRTRITEIQALSGDHAAAVVTMGAISSERDKGRAAGAIARARAEDGDAEGALAWALTLAPPAVRCAAIRGLAEGVANPR